MINPMVTINTTNHVSPTNAFVGVFTAELTMINTNKGTIRCRIYEHKTRNLLCSNMDLPEDVIVDDEFTVCLR